MKNRYVYILLTDTGSNLTKLIKLFTKKPLNHASIAVDSQLMEVYSFGRKKPLNPFIGGFVKENIRSGLFKEATSAIYCCSITEKQYQQMLTKIKKIEDNKQAYKYNFLGLFAVLFNKRLERKNAYFCSHFVATILNESGIQININKPLSLVTPHDLNGLPSFQLIYEGKLPTYLASLEQNEKNEAPIIQKSQRKYERYNQMLYKAFALINL
jgi:hypothetical protein